MKPFVLVHGTGGGSWCWRFLTPLLQVAGHNIYSPTLTGLGSSSHLLHDLDQISLSTHIKDISNTLFFEDLSDVVLVGHSYAGMVITGVAATVPERMARLVYLDAYLPFDGENEVDLWPQEQQEKYRQDIKSGIKFREPPGPEILGITDPEVSKWMQERLTPHPYSTYEDAPPPSTPQSASIPRTYIHCTQGSFASWMKPFADRTSKLGYDIETMAAPHEVMITHPKELANILLRIAKK